MAEKPKKAEPAVADSSEETKFIDRSGTLQLTQPTTAKNLDHPALRGVRGPLENKRFELSKLHLSIGRDPTNDICLPDPLASRTHAEFIVSPDFQEVLIRDLKSANGTLVNSRAVLEAKLRHGDFIQVGNTLFKYYEKGREDAKIDESLMNQFQRIDPLTNLSNKKAINETLELEFITAKRSRGFLSLLVLDIDHFKSINDLHGHSIGDLVLAQVAKVAKAKFKGWPGLVGRFGGEEFVFIVPGLPSQPVEQFAKDLCREIETMTFTQVAGLRVTVSIGVAHLNEQHTKPLDLFEASDMAMYAAKQAGRNQVIIA